MNRKLEVLLTVLALVGLYSAIPQSISRPNNSRTRAGQTVMLADGSDPMPLCRTAHCSPQ
jgi:hypothetical protein